MFKITFCDIWSLCKPDSLGDERTRERSCLSKKNDTKIKKQYAWFEYSNTFRIRFKGEQCRVIAKSKKEFSRCRNQIIMYPDRHRYLSVFFEFSYDPYFSVNVKTIFQTTINENENQISVHLNRISDL